MKELLKKQNGITLIALVITIIVLLILAGVSIAMLTGENGILNQAQEAKEQTAYKSAEEKVNLAIMGARADDGQMTIEELKKEVEYQRGSITSTSFPAEVEMDGYIFIVNENGETGQKNSLGTVTGQEKTNKTVYDKLGNQVVVPSGFKIQNPDQTVLDGIVIEDVNKNRKTAGSEFVWIPVGNVKKADESTVSIKLSRYTFNGTTGKEIDKGDTAIAWAGYNFQELVTSDKGNTTAKDINVFKASVENNKGYYIGRYEARDKDTTAARTSSTSDKNQLVCTADNYVYNYVTQPQAAELSRNMYNDSNFTSDLINSYAWDTAITFLQTFDNRANKTKLYSLQESLNSTLAEKGTNDLEKKDVICNVYDMASNTYEWTTETCSSEKGPCVFCGGAYNNSNFFASSRYFEGMATSLGSIAFRPILYL